MLSRLFYWKHFELESTQDQTLKSGTIAVETQQIDVSNLTQGMYFINVVTRHENSSYNKKEKPAL